MLKSYALQVSTRLPSWWWRSSSLLRWTPSGTIRVRNPSPSPPARRCFSQFPSVRKHLFDQACRVHFAFELSAKPAQSYFVRCQQTQARLYPNSTTTEMQRFSAFAGVRNFCSPNDATLAIGDQSQAFTESITQRARYLPVYLTARSQTGWPRVQKQ